MKLLEVADQFANKETSIDHLFRVQAARCHEFAMFLNYCTTKYMTEDPPYTRRIKTINDYLTDESMTYLPSVGYRTTLLQRYPNFSLNDLDKLVKKHSRMVTAKRTFERAGGKYPYHKHDDQSD